MTPFYSTESEILWTLFNELQVVVVVVVVAAIIIIIIIIIIKCRVKVVIWHVFVVKQNYFEKKVAVFWWISTVL
jgi:hypothetical protein